MCLLCMRTVLADLGRLRCTWEVKSNGASALPKEFLVDHGVNTDQWNTALIEKLRDESDAVEAEPRTH